MKKVLIGLSGGVDSTAAAIILKKKGYEVIGITLKLWSDAQSPAAPGGRFTGCRDDSAVLAAQKACKKLGIKHYVIDAEKPFTKKVVDYFIKSYTSGKTPNPCAVCNEEIKFKLLLKMMKERKFDFIATGHYAQAEKGKKGIFLKKGKDGNKTQEYFLSRLKKEELKRILFPLGKMTKDESRKIAAKYVKAGKKESREACFLREGESPYEFINRMRNAKRKMRNSGTKNKGFLYDGEGNKLKELDYDYFKYTVGQRKGLNYSAGKPVYVTKIDAKNRAVYIGEMNEVFSDYFRAEKLNMYEKTKKKFTAEVKIRYLHKQAKADIIIKGDRAKVKFKKPQFAVTPGQLAVFYKKDKVVGSGFIM